MRLRSQRLLVLVLAGALALVLGVRVMRSGRGAKPAPEETRPAVGEDTEPEASTLAPQEFVVECRARPVVRGQVVDERGLPREDVCFMAVQISASAVESLSGFTDEGGGYQLEANEPGRMQIAFLPPDATRAHRIQLDAPRGLTKAPDVALARFPADSIGGSLRYRSGARWTEASVRLRALDGSRYEQVQSIGLGTLEAWRVELESDGVVDGIVRAAEEFESFEFFFEDVPPGRFELSVVSREGFRWSPAALVVQAQSDGIVFTVDDTVPLVAYDLDLRDAETGALIAQPIVLVRPERESPESGGRLGPGAPLTELAAGVAFEWSVTSPGYALVRGSERDFVGSEENRTAKVELPRGFGVRMVFLDRSESIGEGIVRGSRSCTRWDAARLAGVEVRADGTPVALSDERGIAELDLPAKPKRLELSLAGFRVLDSPSWRAGELCSGPEAEVWMMRE